MKKQLTKKGIQENVNKLTKLLDFERKENEQLYTIIGEKNERIESLDYRIKNQAEDILKLEHENALLERLLYTVIKL